MKKRGDTKKQMGSAIGAKPIETLYEAFDNGFFIEPVHDPVDRNTLTLMFFNGNDLLIAPGVEHDDRIYEPCQIDPSIAREVYLPAEVRLNEPVSQLGPDVTQLLQQYCGLPDQDAELTAQFFFADWLKDALPAAPSLMVIGPDCPEVSQFFALAKCLSRHGLVLTGVTAGSLSALPTQLGLMVAIDQPEIDEPLGRLLNASRKRLAQIPRRGALWCPYFSKIIRCASQDWPIEATQLVIRPNGHALPLLDEREQLRIAREFQPRLLGYRFANYGPLRARLLEDSLAACAKAPASVPPTATFEDADLQAKILELVADSPAEASEEDRWTDQGTVLRESLLVASHLPNLEALYMGQFADTMMTMLSARGEERKIRPKQAGAMVRALGFSLEPRDSRGIRLLLTESVRKKIHQLAYDFGVPSSQTPVASCRHCEDLRKKLE